MVDEKVKVTFQVKAVCRTIISPQVQLKDGNNSESPSLQLAVAFMTGLAGTIKRHVTS